MASPFRSFNSATLVNQPERPPSKTEMAADLMEETCLRLKELKAEALAAEAECEPSKPWNAQAAECYQTIEALLKGPHRWVCVPVLLEQFPEMVRPVTPEEQAAVERYLAAQKAASDA